MRKEGDVFTEECEICGKRFISLSKKQAEFNFKVHLISCEKKRREKQL